jgi:hypothetical protein
LGRGWGIHVFRRRRQGLGDRQHRGRRDPYVQERCSGAPGFGSRSRHAGGTDSLVGGLQAQLHTRSMSTTAGVRRRRQCRPATASGPYPVDAPAVGALAFGTNF